MIRPVPVDASIEELRAWCVEVWEFLRYPQFHVIRFVPRSDRIDPQEGDLYYDGDDDKLKIRNGTPGWDDCN